MRHSRALAVAAIAAALATGSGCVTRSTYERDLAAEQSRTETERLRIASLQEKLDQANKDVKKAWDALAEKAVAYTANQKAADDARRQVAGLKQQIERLQNSSKDAEKNAKAAADKAEKASNDAAEKLKKLQDQFDAVQKENAALRELAEKQYAQIAELKARLEEKNPVPAPPVQPTTTTPATNAPAPAGK
jgi:chromosome segregation ATPase